MKKETVTFDGVGTYVGEVKEGAEGALAPHGQGTLTYVNGDKYVGEWRDSLVNGQATFTRSDGWKDFNRSVEK